MPYYNHGTIYPGVYNPIYNSKGHNELRQIVTDKARLEEKIEHYFSSKNIVQRTEALTYRYYIPMPYMSQVQAIDEQQVHSIFWTVVGVILICGKELILAYLLSGYLALLHF